MAGVKNNMKIFCFKCKKETTIEGSSVILSPAKKDANLLPNGYEMMRTPPYLMNGWTGRIRICADCFWDINVWLNKEI